MYDTLRGDLRRMEEFTKSDRSIYEVSCDLADYVTGRIELIDLYPFSGLTTQ